MDRAYARFVYTCLLISKDWLEGLDHIANYRRIISEVIKLWLSQDLKRLQKPANSLLGK